jgi:isopentenyl diphosphate isomerase/L-lactate dehydrogenase-like FMN-dependent dehydrogenase
MTSNHGGRQLDQGEGALDVLPVVVRAVRGRADVVMAIALGARAVGVGKRMGVTALKDLNPPYVKKAMPVGLPTVTSAFPRFEEQTRK